jgi:hypothetical protein
MFEVQYRCVYRDFWYQDLETFNGGEALARARQLALQRYVRIVQNGQIVWASGPTGAVQW